MNKLVRFLKNFDRRMKVAAWRRKKRHVPLPFIDKAILGTGIAISFTAVLAQEYVLAEATFWLGAAAVLGVSGLRWIKGQENGKKGFLSYLVATLVFGVLPLVMIGAACYVALYDHLPKQVENDAYVKANAEAFEHNVDHYMDLHAKGGLRAVDDHTLPFKELAPVFTFAMMKAPLIVKSWVGEIPGEDVDRHAFWDFPKTTEIWLVMPNAVPTEERGDDWVDPVIPDDATHPFVYMLFCKQTSDGRTLVEPFFSGLPSHEVDRPDFEPYLTGEGIPERDHPGQIKMPYGIHGFDVSTLEVMAPLADACRDLKPSAGAAE